MTLERNNRRVTKLVSVNTWLKQLSTSKSLLKWPKLGINCPLMAFPPGGLFPEDICTGAIANVQVVPIQGHTC